MLWSRHAWRSRSMTYKYTHGVDGHLDTWLRCCVTCKHVNQAVAYFKIINFVKHTSPPSIQWSSTTRYINGQPEKKIPNNKYIPPLCFSLWMHWRPFLHFLHQHNPSLSFRAFQNSNIFELHCGLLLTYDTCQKKLICQISAKSVRVCPPLPRRAFYDYGRAGSKKAKFTIHKKSNLS